MVYAPQTPFSGRKANTSFIQKNPLKADKRTGGSVSGTGPATGTGRPVGLLLAVTQS